MGRNQGRMGGKEVRYGKHRRRLITQRGNSGRMSLLCCDQELLPTGQVDVGQLWWSEILVTGATHVQLYANQLGSVEEMDKFPDT